MLLKLIQSTITHIILILKISIIKTMLDFQSEMNSQTILMVLMLLNPCINPLWWQSWLGHHCSCLHGLVSNQIISFITHGKKELFHQCSEESMLSEDILPVKKDALLVNFVKLLAQLLPLSSNPSQDQMDLEELLSMILIWLNVFSVASAKKHAL